MTLVNQLSKCLVPAGISRGLCACPGVGTAWLWLNLDLNETSQEHGVAFHENLVMFILGRGAYRYVTVIINGASAPAPLSAAQSKHYQVSASCFCFFLIFFFFFCPERKFKFVLNNEKIHLTPGLKEKL